jgi:hypothetical protein
VDRLEKLDQPFGRVCALVLLKTRNLGLGCYSLCLDGLAQEAGALFRPLLEGLELLVYFRLEPTRINEALEERLPKAGDIARKIEGKFKGVRDHLNRHASHLSVAPEAMAHFIDFRAGWLRLVQPYNEGILRRNLRTLLAVLVWLAIEAVNCISVGEGISLTEWRSSSIGHWFSSIGRPRRWTSPNTIYLLPLKATWQRTSYVLTNGLR